MAAAFLHARSKRELPAGATSGAECSGAGYLLALLGPPAIVALLFLARLLQREIRRHKAKCRRAAQVAAQRPAKAVALSVQRPVKQPQTDQPAAESREIEVRVIAIASPSHHGAISKEASVSIDCYAPGAALLQRARGCLGDDLSERLELAGSDGHILDMSRPLRAQGICSGDVLLAQLGERAAKPPEPTVARKRQELTKFSYSRHFSQHSESGHRFHLTVAARQEAAALAEANEDSVSVDFENDSFSLTIRGKTTDYVLRRRCPDLRIAFELCPQRCSFTVVAGRKIELILRPYPVNFLEPGTRVRVLDLKVATHLNGTLGTVMSFCESTGKFIEERYAVKLDINGAWKRLQRKNLNPVEEAEEAEAGGNCLVDVEQSPPHSADEAAGSCREAGEEAEAAKGAEEASTLQDTPLAWSARMRESGNHDKRLAILASVCGA
eukprot:TRINITY_DN25861_c0_g1_i1.p1 TRINITY_DN25861_c0_g1~~TRINITY_DN25861_c0_g1_i1.p1  ORF type:complete len:440 (+),score=105.34 TRINITY_DN25861_c0_g1_i1:62-1381(+)